jgi:hypothetical protein
MENMKMFINHDEENENRINGELKRCNMPYKLRDREGNAFTYGYIENGFAVYRGKRGSKHIFDARGYEVVQQYCKLTD